MKKILSLSILFFVVISQLQIGVIYASETAKIQNQKNVSKQQLDAVGELLTTTVGQLNSKTKNKEKSKKILEKGKEIEAYIRSAQKEILSENSVNNIKEKVEEVKKVGVLKVVSGVTDYENIENNISSDVASSTGEKSKALEVSRESLEGEDGGYAIIMRSTYGKNKFQKTLLKLDDTLNLEYLYKVGEYRYFEVSFSQDSIFAREMFEDISRGIIPKSIIGIEIVKPEVFKVEKIQKEKNLKKKLLSGEDFSQTWGIEEYKTYRYFSESRKASKKIKVGVVDTGIDYTHPDLKSNVLQKQGRDFVNKDRDAMDDQGHGTHVAGTIAANINQSGIIGVNPYVKLVPLKICSETGFCPTYAVIRALKYAEKKNIDILNMSLGGRSDPIGHAICDAIESYTYNGGIVVAAAGNSNIDTNNFVPGGCEHSITVGAYDRNYSKASFSNYGNNVDVSAPGVDIYSTSLGGGYKKLSGTSMSTPHVTGIVSLMKSYQNELKSSETKTILFNASNTINSSAYIAGAINFDELILSLKDSSVTSEVIADESIQEDQEIVSTGEDVEEVETGTGGIIDDVAQSYVKKDTSFDDNQSWVQEGNISGPQRQTIKIGDIIEILEISSDTSKVESIDIDQEVEELKIYPKNTPERVFGEEGYILENPTQIQGNEVLQVLEANGEETQGYGDEILEEDEDRSEIFEVQELLIDGAKPEIGIQSSLDVKYLKFMGDEESYSISGQDGENLNVPVENKNFIHDSEIYLNQNDGVEKQVYTESGEIIGEELSGYETGTITISNLDVSEDKKDTETIISRPHKITDTLLIGEQNNDISINSTNEITKELKVPEYTGETWDIESGTGFLFEDLGEVGEGEVELMQDFSSIEPISRIDMGEVTEPYISEDGTESIGIQNVYTCEVELGSSCDFSLYKPSRYSFVPDIANMATVTFEDRLASFQGKKVGQVTYTMSLSGRTYHTFVINIVEPQVEETYNISLVRRETKILNIDTRSFWYSYQSDQGGGATVRRLSNGLQFTGTSDGIYTYYAQKYDRTGFLFKVVVQVTPYIPPVDTVDMYIGQTLNYPFGGAHTYTLEKNNDNINIWKNGYNAFGISTNSLGTTEVILKYRGDHTHTLIVNVLELPVPEEIQATAVEGKDVNIILPRDARFTFALEAGYTGYARLYDIGDYVLLRGFSPGEAIYRIMDNGITHYILNLQILPKEPIIIDTEIFQGQQQIHQISNGNNYDYTVTQEGIVSLQNTSGTLYITGEQVGNTQITLSIGGFPHYIINTQINTPPEPERLQINTQELLSTNISLNPGSYRWTQEKTGDASASITYNQSTGIMSIYGHVEGEITLTIIDQSNLVRYILDINIIPNPPQPQEIDILETREERIEFNYGDTYSFSSSGIIGLRQVSSVLYLQGLAGGYVELYVRNSAGRHYKTYLVTVEPAPTVEEYSIDINVKQSGEITLPENISNYKFYIDTHTPFTDSDHDKSFSISGDRTFRFTGEQSGTSVIELRDSRNFAIYRVMIRVNIYEVDFEIIQTEERDSGLSSNHRHVSDDSSIAYVSNGYDEIKAISSGTVSIKSYDDGIHYRTTHVTVLPIPDPIQINCDMYRGETCRLDYTHGGRGISYTTSRSDAFEVEYGNSTLRVKGLAVGTARVTVKALYGDYIKYIMNVNVLPQPPEVHDCEVPQGTICQTMWWDDYGSYRITTTDVSVVRVGLEQYSQTFANGTRKMERTVIEGLMPGYAEVYIYENQDHRYTVRMTVTEPVAPISVEDGSVTLKQGEGIELDIVSGGGDYRVVSYDEDLIFFDTDNPSGGIPNIDITGKNPGISYPKFRDKYYQEYQMSVKITDTTLELNGPDENNEFIFNTYQPQYISARNYYGDVYLSTSNNNFSVRKDVFDDGQIGFLITPIENGETTFTFTDNEPGGVNTKTVLVKVLGGGNSEETPTEQDSEFESLFLLNDESDTTLQKILAFNILGNYTEVGIEMKNEFGEYVRQSIDKNEDGFYILQLDKDICNDCNSFIPYFIDFLGNTVYAQQIGNYLSYNEDKFKNITLENSRIGVANFNTDIRISGVKEYWRQIELATTDVVIAGILGSAVAYGQLSSKIDYLPHDLPIASYMLARFMKGDGGYDYYNSTHWISEELKLTSWYSDRKEYITGNIDSFSDLNVGEEEPIDFEIEKIYDVNSERQQDFANSFGNIGWNQYVTKKLDGNIEMIIKISDDYDFHLFKGSVFIGGNNLNGWAEYYQSRGYGKPFTWNLSIYELIN